MVLTIDVDPIRGEDMERVGQKLSRVVLLEVTGDASTVSQAMATNWWREFGFRDLKMVEPIEPLTAATPDEDEYHLFKFSSDFGTLYLADSHAGSPMGAVAMTAKMRLYGTP